MLTSLTKGGGGVSQLLTITDKGGGVQTPPNMADIICEQSLVGQRWQEVGEAHRSGHSTALDWQLDSKGGQSSFSKGNST